MLILCVSHFRLPVWFLLTSLSYTRGWSLNEVWIFLFLLPSLLSAEAALFYMAETEPVEWVKEETEKMSLLWNSLRAVARSDYASQKNLNFCVLQSQRSSILMNYQTFTQACGQHSQLVHLGLHCSSNGVFILVPWAGCTGRTWQGAGWCRPGHTVLLHILRNLQSFWGAHILKSNANFSKHPCKTALLMSKPHVCSSSRVFLPKE